MLNGGKAVSLHGHQVIDPPFLPLRQITWRHPPVATRNNSDDVDKTHVYDSKPTAGVLAVILIAVNDELQKSTVAIYDIVCHSAEGWQARFSSPQTTLASSP